MPYYQRKKALSRNSRRYTRRRTYRSRRTPYQRRPSSQVAMYKNVTSRAPFGPFKFTKMTYVEGPFNITCPGTDIPAGTSFGMNAVYDPDLSVGGSQPQYFDSMLGAANSVAPYGKYCVTGCKVTAIFTTNSSTTAGENPGVAIWSNPGSGVFDSSQPFKDVMEMPWSRTAILGRNSDQGANPSRKLTMYVPMHTFFGVSKQTIQGDEDYSAVYNANPAKTAAVHCAVYNTSTTASGVNSVDVFIKLNYYIKFYNLWTTNARN